MSETPQRLPVPQDLSDTPLPQRRPRRKTGAGRPSKGDRSQVSMRVYAPYREMYEDEAAKAGLSLTTYLDAVLAHAHNLPAPPYLKPESDQPELVA